MYFLVRCAFWIALVFLVVPMVTGGRDGGSPAGDAASALVAGLPSAGEATANTALGVIVGEVLSPSATPAPGTVDPGPDVAVLSDIVRFCGDNGEVCAAGFSAIDALGGAIGEGLTLIASLTSDEEEAVAEPGPIAVRTTTVSALPVGTLSPDDIAEPWRGTGAAVVAGTAGMRLPPPDPRRQPPG